MARVLIVDNYDSFTHNLAHGFEALGATVDVWRNDSFTLEEAGEWEPTHLVISPGPGTPDESGISKPMLRHFLHRLPILGVCLGHQALVEIFGGVVGAAFQPVHGKQTLIEHGGTGLFWGLPCPLPVGRYHSLVATQVPSTLEITAQTPDGEPMAVRLPDRRVYGVQFHPESILTPDGCKLLQNFLTPAIEIRRITFIDKTLRVRLKHVYEATLPGDPGKMAVQGSLLLGAFDGALLVGFKLGQQRGNTFTSEFGGVLPAYRRLGIGRSLIQAQHLHLANLLRDGGTILTHTKNRFRGMLLLNLESGFVITRISQAAGTLEPYLQLELSIRTPRTTEPAEVLVPGRMVAILRTSIGVSRLIREGYDVVGNRVTLAGEQLLLEKPLEDLDAEFETS